MKLFVELLRTDKEEPVDTELGEMDLKRSPKYI
jgi:hypothetical protein